MITITNSIYLATQKTIDADMVTSLTITGNPDDSTLTSAPRQGVVIKTDDTPVNTNLNLTVSNLTFSGFDDSGSGGTASALTAESLAGLTVALTNVSFINNFGEMPLAPPTSPPEAARTSPSMDTRSFKATEVPKH